jgi:hypothetical protein
VARSFWGHFGDHLYQSAALIATLACTIATFVYARDYVWIPLTFLVVFVAAALLFCRRMHDEAEETQRQLVAETQRRQEAEGQVEQERQIARRLVEAARLQGADAEARASRLVAEALHQYQSGLTGHSAAQLTRALAARMEFAHRMRLFSQNLSNPVEVRKIESLAGRLFVIVRLDVAAMKHLRAGDPFLLVEQTASGVQAEVALLQLNQPPDRVRKAAHFLVSQTFAGAAVTLERLSREDSVEPLRRYQVKLALDITRYRNLRIEDAIAVMHLLAGEAHLESYRGERP